MSAPTTEEVRGALKIARAALEASGTSPDASLYAGMVEALERPALPIAEHRDALAQRVAELEAERLRALKIGYQWTQDCQSLPEMAQALVDAIGHLSKQVDKEFAGAVALDAEVKRLREVIATKHAIERSSVGVAALAEECETLRAEVKRRGELLAAERERYVRLQGTLDAERRAFARRSVEHMEAEARFRKAAAARLDEGHNDTCGARLGAYACSCGHDELQAAVQEKST